MNNLMKIINGVLGALILLGCTLTYEHGSSEHISHITGQVNDLSLIKSDDTPENWLTHGGNYSEDRFSELDQIKKSNIDSLGLAWTLNLGTSSKGISISALPRLLSCTLSRKDVGNVLSVFWAISNTLKYVGSTLAELKAT